MKGADSAAQISAMRRAIRQTNFSDSITHGPRINAGRRPPIVTEPILTGFGFTGKTINQKGSSHNGHKGHKEVFSNSFLPWCSFVSFVLGFPSPEEIINRKRQIKRAEKNERQQMHL